MMPIVAGLGEARVGRSSDTLQQVAEMSKGSFGDCTKVRIAFRPRNIAISANINADHDNGLRGSMPGVACLGHLSTERGFNQFPLWLGSITGLLLFMCIEALALLTCSLCFLSVVALLRLVSLGRFLVEVAFDLSTSVPESFRLATLRRPHDAGLAERPI